MHETSEELRRLQALIDASYARAEPHLRSIFRPEYRMSAAELASFFIGRRQVAVATVTAAGAPRVAPVDGLLLHGRFLFGTHRSAARVPHLRARPAVSLVYFERDELAVVVHGTAELLEFGHPEFRTIDEAFVAVYGGTPSTAEEGSVYVRVQPTAMFTYARDRPPLSAVEVRDWPGRAHAEALRQWPVIGHAAGAAARMPGLEALLLLGSFAAGVADDLSDVDLVAVAARGRFDEAWTRRSELEPPGTPFAWDVDEDANAVGSHKWITRELVKVECTIVDPAGGGMRLADPFAVIVGDASVAERFPRRQRPSAEALAAHAEQLLSEGRVPEVEQRYGDLKAALRAALGHPDA